MEVTSPDVDADDAEEECCVFAYRTAPGKTVFTEDGNTDGWIATDRAVDVRR
jgi:hypothetical protein